MAVAYFAKSIALIGVQLVKDMLDLLNGTGWTARKGRGPGRFTPCAVIGAGGFSGLRLALIGHHHDRRGFGNGHPMWLRSPGRSPERKRSNRCGKNDGQRNVRGHPVLHGAPPYLSTAIAAVLPC